MAQILTVNSMSRSQHVWLYLYDSGGMCIAWGILICVNFFLDRKSIEYITHLGHVTGCSLK